MYAKGNQDAALVGLGGNQAHVPSAYHTNTTACFRIAPAATVIRKPAVVLIRWAQLKYAWLAT